MREHRFITIQTAVFALGAAMLIAGIYFEEPAEIMRKAVLVCLECIGIG